MCPLHNFAILFRASSFSLTWGLMHIDSEQISSICADIKNNFFV